MIDASTPCFPNNIVDLIATRAKTYIDPDDTGPESLQVFKRPLHRTDPPTALGVAAAQWLGESESLEMRGGADPPLLGSMGRNEPTLQTYYLTVEAYVKDQDEERGLAKHSVLSKLVRSMLYRDEPLRVGLSLLSVTTGSSTERAQRWGIRQQRFSSREITGAFLYLSTLEFWLETETT